MNLVLTMVLEVGWLFLPGAIANSIPVLAAHNQWFPGLGIPVSRHYLGSNKTWRGVILGVGGAAATGAVQYVLNPVWQSYTGLLLPFNSLLAAMGLGALLGGAALAGDMVKSLLKRRMKIAAGHPWRPWDQIDYVVGMSVVALCVTAITITHIFFALILFGVGSYLTSALGVALHIKKNL